MLQIVNALLRFVSIFNAGIMKYGQDNSAVPSKNAVSEKIQNIVDTSIRRHISG